MRRTLSVVALAFTLLLGACGDGDPRNTQATARTATLPPTPAAPGTPIAGATPSLVSREGKLIGDGVCRARVPLAWTEDAPGTGTTGGGHVFSIFGNALVTDDAWVTASTMLRSQATRQPGSDLDEGGNFVRIVYADGGGLAYRARFGDTSCDIRITGRGGPISEGERATWDAIMASLEPVP